MVIETVFIITPYDNTQLNRLQPIRDDFPKEAPVIKVLTSLLTSFLLNYSVMENEVDDIDVEFMIQDNSIEDDPHVKVGIRFVCTSDRLRPFVDSWVDQEAK